MLKSQKGKDILFYKGYRYRRDRITYSSESWRCPLKTCKGRLLCRGEEKIEKTLHNHGPDPAMREVNSAQNRIKTLAQSTPLKPRTIVQTSLTEVSLIYKKLAKFSSILNVTNLQLINLFFFNCRFNRLKPQCPFLHTRLTEKWFSANEIKIKI